MEDISIYVPSIRYYQGLAFVAIDDGIQVCEYGICPDLLPIDEVEVWVHEFSEQAVHLSLANYCDNSMKIPISLSILPFKCLFRIQHLMVSLHTPSIMRIEDETGKTEGRIILTSQEFEDIIGFQTSKLQ